MLFGIYVLAPKFENIEKLKYSRSVVIVTEMTILESEINEN